MQLRLEPEEVIGGQSLQLQLDSIGHDVDAAQRAARACVQIQGLLGPEAVLMPLLDGGRGPGERVRLVPWGEPREATQENQPRPGRLPTPSPALVPPERQPAQVRDAVGDVVVGDQPARRVVGWAGPWIYRDSAFAKQRHGRIQVSLEADEPNAGEVALLLNGAVGERPNWHVEGIYD